MSTEAVEPVEQGNNIAAGELAVEIEKRFKAEEQHAKDNGGEPRKSLKFFVYGSPEDVDKALKGRKDAVLQCRNREGAEVMFSR